jgi:hypothetical protein
MQCSRRCRLRPLDLCHLRVIRQEGEDHFRQDPITIGALPQIVHRKLTKFSAGVIFGTNPGKTVFFSS